MQDFSFYFGLGWHHIISLDALDHILFIIVLAAIYILTDWKQVLVLVTAFTIGHSITLALSVFDIIRFPGKWIEFLIPCTIVITALSNIFQQKIGNKSVRMNYYLALFFGLIHGMGFANTIRFILAKDQNIGIGLFAFNVGLEVGQIIIVFILLLLAYLFIRLLKVNRREWILFLSAAVFSLALKMVFERIP
ncbi:MAG: HupE/UreJ family protein [Chitinophagaceae bacterium]